MHNFEEDRLIPISVGGNPRDMRNLWPEPRSGFVLPTRDLKVIVYALD